MKRNELPLEVDKVKNEIVNNTLIFGSILGFISYLISFANVFTVGFHFSIITDLFSVSTFAVIAIYRNKLTIVLKRL